MNESARISALIRFSWGRAKQIAFPFEFKRWLKILIIIWLSGHAAGFGGGSSGGRNASQDQVASDKQQMAETAQDQLSSGQTGEEASPQNEPVLTPPATSENAPRKQVINALLIFIIPLVLGLSVFLLWLNARFNFIFLDLLVHRDISIGESFKKFKEQGNSYFKCSLSFFLVVSLAALLIFLMAAMFRGAAPVTALLILSIVLFLALGFFLMIAAFLVQDFVLPMMYRDKAKILATIKKFMSVCPKIGSLFVYYVVKFGLGVAAALMSLVLTLLCVLIFFLVALLFVLPAVLLAKVAPVLTTFIFVLGFFVGLVLFAGLLLTIGFVTLPISLFFGVFSLAYLARLIPQYDLIGLRDARPDITGI